jgi:hypothetical protein
MLTDWGTGLLLYGWLMAGKCQTPSQYTNAVPER